ncbi:MAG: hypothetical protein H7067_00305 [Burkholderiales bacterium]|nr:hypothetical protein [Opitutaceae bacterium]
MKKILWFLFALALAAGLGAVLENAWGTTKFFQENGREATIKVGRKYNASRWIEPVPIKKVHSYVATLSPSHEVLIETDQSLKENEEYFIRFLFRDEAVVARQKSLRPLVGTIRLKAEADGAPVQLADTNIFDRAVDKAMGPPAEGVYVRPREVAENAPAHDKPTVPFMVAGAADGTIEIIWNNSGLGEIILVAVWLVVIKMIALHAWVTPFNPNRPTGTESKKFVHPSMRHIAADTPDAPSAKIAYKPKPAEPDFVPPPKPVPAPAPSDASVGADAPSSPQPKPTAIPLPPGAKSPTAPNAPSEPYSTSTTSPFVPAEGTTEPTLKLTRKPKATPTTPATPPPDTAA